MNDGVEVRASAVHGTGLFARRAFRAGEVVYTVAKGMVVSREGIAGLTALQRNHLDRIGEDAFEVIEPPGCDINHSCDPNVAEPARRGVALRDIAAGEEITLDYDPIACIEKPFPCRCGAARCRGEVRGTS